jgi:hypothetical protein
MFGWLTKPFSRAKRKYSTSLKRSRKPIPHVSKKTIPRVKIGRPPGPPTEKLTLQIEKGLKPKYREFCDKRNMSISFAVSAHMKEDLALQASQDYRTHLIQRHKPKKKVSSPG